jgi:hypothetical protein
METVVAVERGRTDWKRFWAVIVVAFALLAGITTMVAKGMVALASTLPLPFTIKSSSIHGSNFTLVPGIAKSDGQTPVSVIQMDGTMQDMQITKSIDLPGGGTLNLTISAGSHTAVSGNGLTIDAASVAADSQSFDKLTMDSGKGLSAPSFDMKNATLQVPYLYANSITLPDLNLSVSFQH